MKDYIECAALYAVSTAVATGAGAIVVCLLVVLAENPTVAFVVAALLGSGAILAWLDPLGIKRVEK